MAKTSDNTDKFLSYYSNSF